MLDKVIQIKCTDESIWVSGYEKSKGLNDIHKNAQRNSFKLPPTINTEQPVPKIVAKLLAN